MKNWLKYWSTSYYEEETQENNMGDRISREEYEYEPEEENEKKDEDNLEYEDLDEE